LCRIQALAIKNFNELRRFLAIIVATTEHALRKELGQRILFLYSGVNKNKFLFAFFCVMFKTNKSMCWQSILSLSSKEYFVVGKI
jgi:hypothetical protein